MSGPSIDDIARSAARDLTVAEQARAVPAPARRPSTRRVRGRSAVLTAGAVAAIAIASLAILQVVQTPSSVPSIGQIEPVPPAGETEPDPSDVESLPPLADETGSVLVLSTDQHIGVVDVDGGTVQTQAHRPTFVAPGDPPVRISVRDGQVVSYAGADMVALPLDDLADGEPAVVGLALYFLPADDERGVWLIRGRDQLEAELVDADGTTLMEPRQAPGGSGTPVAAIADGLILQHEGGLHVWDVANNEIVHHITDETYPLATHGNLVASCNNTCQVTTITDTRTGEQQTIDAPEGTTFRGYRGAFSPDGSLLAAPLRLEERDRGAGIAVIDPSDGSTRVVAREATGTNSGHLGWDATGRWLFFDTETSSRYPPSAQLAVWDRTTNQASAIDIALPGNLVPFYGFAVAPGDAARR